MTIIISGLAVGSIYVLAGLGYALTFAASGVVNFAQGYVVMLGTFLAYLGLNTLSLPLPLVVLLAAAAGALTNAVVERVCVRPVSGRESHAEILTTIGAATIISAVVQLVWGSNPLGLNLLRSSLPVHIADALTPVINLWLIGLALACTALLVLLTRRTRIGMVSQAVAEDREAATLRGINVNILSLGAFIVAGALAAGVGPAVGVETYAITSLGPLLAVKGFVVLALGGTRSYGGVVICGLLIGVLEAEAARYLSGAWQDVVTFVVFLVVLLIRPQGLFGKPRERVV
jgi:branched-chain amino acid transport system permease protein